MDYFTTPRLIVTHTSGQQWKVTSKTGDVYGAGCKLDEALSRWVDSVITPELQERTETGVDWMPVFWKEVAGMKFKDRYRYSAPLHEIDPNCSLVVNTSLQHLACTILEWSGMYGYLCHDDVALVHGCCA